MSYPVNLFDDFPFPDEESRRLFEQLRNHLELSASLTDQAKEIQILRQTQNTQPGGLETFIIQPQDDADAFIKALQNEVRLLRKDYNLAVNTLKSQDYTIQAMVAMLKKTWKEIEKIKKGKK